MINDQVSLLLSSMWVEAYIVPQDSFIWQDAEFIMAIIVSSYHRYGWLSELCFSGVGNHHPLSFSAILYQLQLFINSQ